MSIHVSEDLALALAGTPAATRPVIAWQNLVTADNVTATSEDADYPASNLGNPATTSQQGWRSESTSTQYLTVDLDTDEEVDYLAFARHNFGSALITVSVEGTTDDETWTELVEPFMPANDAPLLMLFESQGLLKVRAKLVPASTAPRAAVMFAGKSLRMEKGLQPHTPIGMGRQKTRVPGESESGDYLGSIVTSSRLGTPVQFNVLTPAWVRAYLDDFCEYASTSQPFFFAWSPVSYPREVGYVWAQGDVKPEVNSLAGFASFSMNLMGIA